MLPPYPPPASTMTGQWSPRWWITRAAIADPSAVSNPRTVTTGAYHPPCRHAISAASAPRRPPSPVLVQNLASCVEANLIARSNCFVYDPDFHLWEDANGLDRD